MSGFAGVYCMCPCLHGGHRKRERTTNQQTKEGRLKFEQRDSYGLVSLGSTSLIVPALYKEIVP